jgi:high-affinity iron transporter
VSLAGTALAQPSPADQLAELATHIDAAHAALGSGDVSGTRAKYKAFDEGWFDVEDGVKAQSRASYRAIEDAMGDVNAALAADPIDSDRAMTLLHRLRVQCDAFIKQSPSQSPPTPPALAAQVTLATQLDHLDRAQARLDAQDPAGAATEVDGFRRDWPEVEGMVKSRSPQTYTDTENNMARAYAQLTQPQPDITGARATLTQLKSDLAPFTQDQTSYGLFDAAVILLREGLEALLVVGALLAFLARTSNGDKSRWIWAGSGIGVLASIAIAIVVNVVFAQAAAAGSNREILEGVTGLLAAAMLVYMSYWLHSKASLGAWQQYIRDKSTAALARNSLLSLSLIAFLAVFREGAETVLFYLGIAPSIALSDLVLGLAVGAAGLAALGIAMLRLGLKIPIRPFFLVTSVLIYYLAFKFIGTGLHALQVAGVMGATPASNLPSNTFFGVFPTWETTVVQAALLLGALTVVGMRRLRRPANAKQALVGA